MQHARFKRQVLVGAAYPSYGLATGYGYGIASYGYGYPAYGYPAYSGLVYGRKKSSTDEVYCIFSFSSVVSLNLGFSNI